MNRLLVRLTAVRSDADQPTWMRNRCGIRIRHRGAVLALSIPAAVDRDGHLVTSDAGRTQRRRNDELHASSGVACESALLRSKSLGEVRVERTGPRAQQPRLAGCGVDLKRCERRDLHGLAAVDLDAQ